VRTARLDLAAFGFVVGTSPEKVDTET